MGASTEAIVRLLEACEGASDAELMALGRAVNSLEWTDDTSPGADMFLALIQVPLAVYVERVLPEVGLDEVVAMFEKGVTNGG